MRARNTAPQEYRQDLVDAPPPWRRGADADALRDEELGGWERDKYAALVEEAAALESLESIIADGARTWIETPAFPAHPAKPPYPATQRAGWLTAVVEQLRKSTKFVDGKLVERGRPPGRAWDVSAALLPAYLASAVDVRQNDFAFPREVYVRAARLVTIWRDRDAEKAVLEDPFVDVAIRREQSK